MKSILLHVNETAECAGRLHAALDLARAMDAHLTCLQAVNLEIFAPADFYGATMSAIIPQIRQNAERFRAKMEADLANEDVAWEWVVQHRQAEHALLDYSPICDLLVVGPRDGGEAEDRASRMVGDLVMKARTPVLVVPRDQKGFDCNSPAIVAWNGSSESALALRSAVPMLQRASDVYLVTVSEKRERERYDVPPVRGAEYLSRYGIECEMVDIPRSDTPVADALSSVAQARECGLMVMGAYGHSRLAEWLLGGVTRTSLTDPQIPILLAH